MKHKLSLLLVSLCAVAGLAAGCGDDDKSSSTGTTGSTSTEQTTTSGSSTTTEATITGSGDTSGGGSDNAQVQVAVEACKQNIQSVSTLSDSLKQELTKTCDEAASGDVKSVLEANKKVCTKIAEETVPEGSARDQAIRVCDAVNNPEALK